MTIRTREQLTQDFETLAEEKHHPSVFRASEHIRQHLAAIPAALSAPLETEDVPWCYCPKHCEMKPSDKVCPTAGRVFADLLPVLLKRIGG